jgi:hypothetical protein
MLLSLSDPLVEGGLILTAMFGVTLVLSWLLHKLSVHAETRVPTYRRQLDATYASFHRFLMAVRAAAVRGVRQ